jgi:hypothetical protein
MLDMLNSGYLTLGHTAEVKHRNQLKTCHTLNNKPCSNKLQCIKKKIYKCQKEMENEEQE